NNLAKEILSSNLSENAKEVLFKETIRSLQNNVGNDTTIKQKLLQLVGNKAFDYFTQLAAAVSAGLIIREI
ncbi:MAG: hypothetical protein HYT27_00890, partial [Parcubacteria group bacterium]|nr:hypothetical protein [Parcubacteria group bacterium]